MSEPSDRVRRMAATLADRYTDISHDSRQVRPGWLFACVPGEHHDGHDFAGSAVSRGATGLLVERPVSAADLGLSEAEAETIDQFVVDDVREAIGEVAAAIHGHPSRRLKVVGITGTNGKTTTTHILTDILNELGQVAVQIGTLSGERTTPEAADLQRVLAGFVADGVQVVVMEVSSHALELDRVVGTHFELGVFTNLGHDHLDLHGDLENYYAAKASLFEPWRCSRGLANADDRYGLRLKAESDVDITMYSVDDVAEVSVKVDRIEFRWRGQPASLSFGGSFNLSNALAAMESARLLGHDVERVSAALGLARPVPGRFEPVSGAEGQPTVIVDYAHTPDGLENLLTSTRALRPNARIVLTFGCGGDRDHDKRPVMGRVASEGADLVVLTSDNPRSEDPQSIIDDIRAGMNSQFDGVIVEQDRATAIQRSLELAAAGDIVLIAGKGHEQNQAVGDRVIPFDDRAVAAAALESTR